MAAFNRRRLVRMAPVVRSGVADSGESNEESEDADMNGGAAAWAAASRIEAIGDELQGLQGWMADLLMERRELQEGIWSEEADQQEADESRSDVEYSEGQQDVNEVATTVENLATNVIAEMLEGTSMQIGQVEGTWMQRGCDAQGMLSGVVVFESAEVPLETQQGFDGVELCGREMQVRVGVCVRERCSDVEEAFGGSCNDVEEDSDSSQTDEEI